MSAVQLRHRPLWRVVLSVRTGKLGLPTVSTHPPLDSISTYRYHQGMNKMICDDFRTNVARHLDKQRISRSDLARKMKVSPQYVSIYLNGHKDPGLKVLERFAFALGTTAGALLKKSNGRG